MPDSSTNRVRKFRADNPERERELQQRRTRAEATLRRRYPDEYDRLYRELRAKGQQRHAARDEVRKILHYKHRDEWRHLLCNDGYELDDG